MKLLGRPELCHLAAGSSGRLVRPGQYSQLLLSDDGRPRKARGDDENLITARCAMLGGWGMQGLHIPACILHLATFTFLHVFST